MTSPLTGGFDLCFEVTEAVLNDHVSSTFPTTQQEFPFTVDVPSVPVPISGTASLLIDSAVLTLDSQSPNAVVTMHFSDSALTITTPSANAMPLAGTVMATVPFDLSAPAGNPPSRNLQLDFANPSNQSPTVIFDPGPSMGNVQQALAKVLPPSVPQPQPSQILTMLGDAMKNALATHPGAVTVPPPWSMAPAGKDGSLGPPPQFQPDITAVTLGGAPGVLCILGTILLSDVANDHPKNKTTTVTDGSHQVSIAMSPGLVQGLVTKFANVPKGLTVTATLENEQIAIHVGGTITEPGVSIDVTGDATVTLSLTGGVLTPHVTVVDQHISINLDWWVWLLSIVVPEVALIGGIPVVAFIDGIANEVASNVLQQFLSGLVSDANNFGVNTGGLGAGLTFDHVAIQQQGITLQGHVPIATPSSTTGVRGIVTATNEAAISDATVLLQSNALIPLGNGDTMQLSTDTSGMYDATVPPGVYVIYASADGFVTSPNASVTVPSGKTTTQDFQLTAELPFVVEGTITDGAGGPISGANVTLGIYANSGYSYTTQLDGKYKISGSPDDYFGQWTLTASAAGCAPKSKVFSIPNGATLTGENLTLDLLGSLKGVVTDSSQPPQSIPAAEVRADTLSTFSDQSGLYSLGPIPPGTTTVEVNAIGYDSLTGSVTVAPGAPTPHNFQLIAGTAKITGKVTDATTGNALVGATVTCGAGGPAMGAKAAKATAAADGTYEITGIPAGSFTVTAFATDHTGQSAHVQLTDQQALYLPFELPMLVHTPPPKAGTAV